MGWAFLAARLFMGSIFIYASIAKIAKPAAFAKDMYNYQVLPDVLINLTALVLPWLELFLGLCLLAGIWMPGAVLAVNGLLIAFLGALVFNMARGLDVDCGCFSTQAAGKPADLLTVLRDLTLLSGSTYLTYMVFFFKTHGSKSLFRLGNNSSVAGKSS